MCEHFIREKLPHIRIAPGSLAGRIEIELKKQFDLVICFHVLTHSLDVRRDLETLRKLVAPNGYLICCDEIGKKLHNPFHLIHPDEQQMSRMLGAFFGNVVRLDNCGVASHSIAPYTLRHDNPDLVAWGA